jgi:H+/gluconate symporter-like permease
MAKSSLPKKPAGIALIVIGAGLAFWGTQKSEGLESQLSSAITGSHSDNVMILYIAGAVCAVVGAYLLARN